MSRVFNKEDVKRWQKRFDELDISCHLIDESSKIVAFYQKTSNHTFQPNITQIQELQISTHFKYKFNYSVPKSNLNTFNKILDDTLNNRPFIIRQQNDNTYTNDKIITPLSELPTIKRTELFINGTDYILHEATLHTQLSNLIMWVTNVEDAFITLSKWYPLDGNGEELSKLPFKLHDIVSRKGKRDECLIKGISYNREFLFYDIIEINEKIGNSIIFGDNYKQSPEFLEISRNSKLVSLLKASK